MRNACGDAHIDGDGDSDGNSSVYSWLLEHDINRCDDRPGYNDGHGQ